MPTYAEVHTVLDVLWNTRPLRPLVRRFGRDRGRRSVFAVAPFADSCVVTTDSGTLVRGVQPRGPEWIGMTWKTRRAASCNGYSMPSSVGARLRRRSRPHHSPSRHGQQALVG